MPNQSTLYELFDSLKQNGRTFGIMQEGIENAVPKVPTLMLKSNIEFLGFILRYTITLASDRLGRIFFTIVFFFWVVGLGRGRAAGRAERVRPREAAGGSIFLLLLIK
jgi:hypothetical protein